jgi:hypothetical protein
LKNKKAKSVPFIEKFASSASAFFEYFPKIFQICDGEKTGEKFEKIRKNFRNFQKLPNKIEVKHI